ncbi:cis-aconitate decarboxylase-like [Saccostrea echinata]|uniref:cis-aconitate decarboxylase-like n=1 Tax=Saccostrea echinata TaxID=191078 RepID=UPI002A80BE1F|nr:cis-aconitate decarboxylase-like [Saccostrea echinata]
MTSCTTQIGKLVQQSCIGFKVLRRAVHQHAEAQIQVQSARETSLSSWTAQHVSNFSTKHLSDRVKSRSKRMILDILGVGLIGSTTVFSRDMQEFVEVTDRISSSEPALIWGTNNRRASPAMAAYINGSNCHSMDFDDTWHPATHPSSPILPTLLALADFLPENCKPSLEDILVAFNCGVQIQGVLLRCSSQSKNIPNRLHPPAIVGVMGSAAASAKLLGLGPKKCLHSLAIAASFAGAPMANAGTLTKPLHAGKSARSGLEAALLADKDFEGNKNILDMESGFGAFFSDYDPCSLLQEVQMSENLILHNQDIAIKSYPCHLGMHWAIDASLQVRKQITDYYGELDASFVKSIEIFAPKSKYINRPVPATEHEARHSFQFTACSALIDGLVSPATFKFQNIEVERKNLYTLLQKTTIINPSDNMPCFDTMYVDVLVTLKNGEKFSARCREPYGHWRKPMKDADVKKKFMENSSLLPKYQQEKIIKLVSHMSAKTMSNELSNLLSS